MDAEPTGYVVATVIPEVTSAIIANTLERRCKDAWSIHSTTKLELNALETNNVQKGITVKVTNEVYSGRIFRYLTSAGLIVHGLY